jgi:hypothetical protein
MALRDEGREAAAQDDAREEALFRLAEALAGAETASVAADPAALGARFGLAEADVLRVRAAVRVLDRALGEDLVPARPPALPPDFEILAELGRGGMGVVYRARQRSLDRTVAVKVLAPGPADAKAVRRFVGEARSLARLRHRHIVAIHEVGEEAGAVFYTMDLVAGGSLAALLRRGKLAPARAVRLLRQVASAIAYTHGHGIIHRDLKPANILLDDAGDAYVADFGLARDLAGGRDLTRTGQILGTPAYMSPEQARGATAEVGEASDVWALGAILYECLAGRPPFAGADLADLVGAITTDDPPPPSAKNPRVPRDLDVICLKALEKDPARRYPSARAMQEDLERFEEGRPVAARGPGARYRAGRFLGRHRAPLGAAAASAALVGLAFFALAPLFDRTPGLLADEAARLVAAGEPGAAAALYEAAIARKPRAAADAARLCEGLVDARIAAARALEAQGRAADALAVYERTADATDSALPHAPADPRLVELRWSEASCAFAAGRPEKAELALAALRRLFEERAGAASPPAPEDAALAPLFDRLAAASFDARDPAHAGARRLLARLFGDSRFGRARARLADDPKRGLALLEAVLEEPPPADDEARFRVLASLDDAATALAAAGARAPLEDALGAAAEDPARPAAARSLATAVLAFAADLPIFAGEPDTRSARDEAAALSLWRETRELPRVAAFRRKVAAAIARLDTLAADRPLVLWLRDRTGQGFASDKYKIERAELLALRDWWRAHADEDPRAWLAAAVSLTAVPEEKDLPALLDRFLAEPPEAAERAPVHHLLTLVAPERVAPPLWRSRGAWLARDAEPEDLPQSWARAVAPLAPAPAARTLRVAAFLVENGDPRPRFVWEERRAIRPGERVAIEREIVAPRAVHDVALFANPGLPERAEKRTPRGPEVAFAGEFGLAWRALPWGDRGLFFDARGEIALGGLGVVQREIPLHVRPGAIAAIEATWLRDFSDGDIATPLVLATIEGPGIDARPWTADDWQRALAARIAALVGADESERPGSIARDGEVQDPVLIARDSRDGESLGRAAELGRAVQLASLVPVPEAREALARLARRFSGTELAVARLLAGDAAALGADPRSEDFARLSLSYSGLWARLALATDEAQVRTFALGELETEGSLPRGVAETLGRAAAEGRLEAPPWLTARIAEARGRGGPPSWQKLREAVPFVGLAAAAALGIVLALRGGRAATPRRRFAADAGLVLLGGLLACARVALDGRPIPVDALGAALAAAGAARLGREASGFVRRVPPAAFGVAAALAAAGPAREALGAGASAAIALAIAALPVVRRAATRRALWGDIFLVLFYLVPVAPTWAVWLARGREWTPIDPRAGIPWWLAAAVLAILLAPLADVPGRRAARVGIR